MLNVNPNHFQKRASNPHQSVWVNASAGSGKTKILIDRFLRLLLLGEPAQKILCLTFTKAAAAEMALRIHQKTSTWTICPDEKLIAELSDLLDETPSDDMIAKARQLFAIILDVPGGLRIQTIHSFCQSVLRRFPLEASLSPHFEAIDEIAAHELVQQVFDSLLTDVSQHKMDGLFTQAFQFLLAYLSEDHFEDLFVSMLDKREEILAFAYHDEADFERIASLYLTELSLNSFQTEQDLINQFIADRQADIDFWRSLYPSLKEGAKTDQKNALIISAWYQSDDQHKADLINDYCSVFLTKDGEPRKKILTKKVLDQHPEADEVIARLTESVLSFLDKKKKNHLCLASTYYVIFATEFLKRYQHLKDQQAVLDYHDLIAKTATLLGAADTVSWVLYKLDGGIDHLLVDEAQDTSPIQWRVISSLVQDFYTGESARSVNRTLFVVGDEKQSIFSFQGADPYGFFAMNQKFSHYAQLSEKAFENIRLQVSFRSNQTILDFVDHVFKPTETLQGVSLSGDEIKHFAYRTDAPGSVELWPLITSIPEADNDQENKETWTLPQAHEWTIPPTRQLAEEIADDIANRLRLEDHVSAKNRIIKPGDIMILLRRRSHLLLDIVRALKKKGIPITGVDRLYLHNQLIVKDMIAVCEWALCPEDDLTLAVILKSPFIGISETDLLNLCAHRNGTLWDMLQQHHTTYANYLQQLLDDSKTLSPFELIASLLQRECPANKRSGRRAIHQRMGSEVDDALDELLSIILTYEGQHISCLQSFTSWMKSMTFEVKREMEQVEDRVRIMTVHGSKGLQAPIVYLPDTFRTQPQSKKIIWTNSKDPLPFFLPKAADGDDQTDLFKDTIRLKDTEEYKRLLYVALTRAEDRLIICGIHSPKQQENSWYHYCYKAIEEIGLPFSFMPYRHPEAFVGQGYKFENTIAAPIAISETPFIHSPITDTVTTLPSWIDLKIDDTQNVKRLVRPSEKESNSFITDGKGNISQQLIKGKIMHQCFELFPFLPEKDWGTLLRKISMQFGGAVSLELEEDLLFQIRKVIQDPVFQFCFSDKARAEVPLIGHLTSENIYVSGQIDRLIETDDVIYFIDFKTSPYVPASQEKIPSSIHYQMNLYRKLLQQIYPAHTIKGAILWTAGPKLMFLEQSE